MKASNLLLVALIVTLAACSAKSNDSKQKETAKVESKKEKSCLSEFAIEPCGLINSIQIAQILKIDGESIETESPPDINSGSKTFKNPLVRYCSFTWPSPRKKIMSIGTVSREVDVDNRIQIGGFKLLDKEEIDEPYIEYFYKYYNAMTEEEFKEFQKKLDEELKEESKDTKETAKKLTNMIPKSTYRRSSGIGDAAVMESNDKNAEARLYILHKNVIFTIVSDISDSWEDNIDLTKKLAKIVLGKC